MRRLPVRTSRPAMIRATSLLVLLLALAPRAARGQAAGGPAAEPPLASASWGSGTPVVIVPGVLGSAYGFRKVVPELVARGFRVTVIDPLGYGASPRPEDADYSFTAQAARLAAAIERQRGGPVILACHALAAPICLRLALHHPALVRGLVSINGGPAEQAGTAQLRMALRFARIVLAIAGRRFALHKLKQGLIDASGDASWVTDSLVARYAEPFGGNVGQVVRVMQRIAGAREPEALAPNLPRIRAPVLLLLATVPGKPGLSLGASERALLRSTLPAFREEEVIGAGQYIQEEQPARVVAAIDSLRARTR